MLKSAGRPEEGSDGDQPSSPAIRSSCTPPGAIAKGSVHFPFSSALLVEQPCLCEYDHQVADLGYRSWVLL
jgi:hypothetical protein